mgnify:CR=1 FL=1
MSDRLEPYAGQVPGALAYLAPAAEAQVLWARTRRPFAFPFGRGMQRMMEELAYIEIPEAEAVPTLRTLDQARETVDRRTRTIVEPWSAV